MSRLEDPIPLINLFRTLRATRGSEPKGVSGGKPKGSVYRQFIEAMEEEGTDAEEEERILNKFVRRLYNQGGWKKETATAELLRRLRKHEEGL